MGTGRKHIDGCGAGAVWRGAPQWPAEQGEKPGSRNGAGGRTAKQGANWVA